MRERILCAAIYFDDGTEHPHQPKNIKRGVVICDRRHHNAVVLATIMYPGVIGFDRNQGFLTSHDRYVDRATAAQLALAAGQISAPTDQLFSEDLY